MNDQVEMFNVDLWQSITLVQGNRAFFNAVRTIIGDDPHFSDFTSDLIEMTSDKEDYNYADCAFYSIVKFNDLIQVNLTKNMAFNLGEKIEKAVTYSGESNLPIRVLFAFSKQLQSAAVGYKPNQQNRGRRF